MRKLLFLIALLVASVSYAQTNVGVVSGSKLLAQDTYVYYLGKTTDTLVENDSLDLLLRVTGSDVPQIGIGLYVTKVSGTITNNFILQSSMDGVNFTNIDTIKLSDASTGMNVKLLSNYNYPYLRIHGVSGATAQKAYYKVYAINRK
jgi:hypothetical protein